MKNSSMRGKKKTLWHPGVADGIPPLTATESRVDADDHEVFPPSGRLGGLVLLRNRGAIEE